MQMQTYDITKFYRVRKKNVHVSVAFSSTSLLLEFSNIKSGKTSA